MRKLTIILIGLLATTMFFQSCSKEHPKDTAAKEKLRQISGSVDFYDFPELEDGMLKFRDEGHFESYINFLGEAIQAGHESVDFDEHQLLQEIEDGLGFVSIRSISHAIAEERNEIGYESPDEVTDEHFIKSNDIKSILNKNLDVRIADRIIHYTGPEFSVVIDADHPEILDAYHGLGENPSLVSVLQIDPARLHTGIFEVKGNGTWPKVPTPLGDQFGITGINFKFNNRCSNPKTATFYGINLMDFFAFQPNQGYFEIDFGDGTPKVYITSSQGINNGYLAEFSHTYPAFGTYTIKLRARALSPAFSGSTYVAEASAPVYIESKTCISEAKDGPWNTQYASATRAWRGHLWVEKFNNFWGTTKIRIASETVSLEKDGSEWKKKKGNICTTVAAELKSGSCTTFTSTYGDMCHSNSKCETVHRTDDAYYWDKVTSTHHMNGVNFPLEINSCD